jgi:hypothetical protein
VLCVRVCVLLLRDQSCMDLVKLFDAWILFLSFCLCLLSKFLER